MLKVLEISVRRVNGIVLLSGTVDAKPSIRPGWLVPTRGGVGIWEEGRLW